MQIRADILVSMTLIFEVTSVISAQSVCSALQADTSSDETSMETEIPFSDEENSESLALLERGDISFTGEFLYQLILDNPNKNLVTSAFSLLIPFGQLCLFSTGEVMDQLLSVLNLRNKTDIEAAFPQLLNEIEEQQSVTLKLATNIYANMNYQLTENFVNKSLEIFDAATQSIDFGQSEQAANTINAWVSEHTDDKIQNLVSADMFDENTLLAMIDAIIFEGNWKTQFNPNDTMDRDFYVSETETIQIPIMYQKSTSMLYGEDDDIDAQIINIPYVGGNFTCGIVLPRNITGLLSTVEKLCDPDKFTEVFNSLSYETVYIYLPKMQISTRIDLPSILNELNVGDMFNADSNGFSGILQGDEPLYISSAVQQAWIKVDEKGVQASAANAFVGARSAAVQADPVVYTFNADHPYLLYILLQGKPIFAAVFVQ